MPSQSAYPLVVSNLAAKLTSTVILNDESRRYFESSVTEADARRTGATIESPTVLDEVLRVGNLAIGPVLDKKLPGYGPLRLRYCLELAGRLADRVAELDSSRVNATGAGSVKVATLRDTRDLRRSALRVVKNLAGRRPEERSRLAAIAARYEEKPDERARSLEELAKEVLGAIAKVPKEVAVDAGATQELVDTLTATAGDVLTTHGGAREARSTVASIYDEMNVLDGRLLHELRLLVGSFKDARKQDKSIPAVTSDLFKASKSKAKKDEKTAKTEMKAAPAEKATPAEKADHKADDKKADDKKADDADAQGKAEDSEA